MQRPKIAILTPLVDFSSSYSLCGIILDQAHMFDRHGYDYDLLVLKNFNKNDIGMEGLPKRVRAILPQTILHDYRWNEGPHDDFDEQIDVHYGGRPETGEIGYKEAVEPYDVIITHDLMFLGSHLCQNAANVVVLRCIRTSIGFTGSTVLQVGNLLASSHLIRPVSDSRVATTRRMSS